MWIESNGTLTQADQQYGPWFRAAPMLSKNNAIMVVPGYYESKRKERAIGNMHREKPTPPKQGGAHGASISETQPQELNAIQPVGNVTKGVTATKIIGDNDNAPNK